MLSFCPAVPNLEVVAEEQQISQKNPTQFEFLDNFAGFPSYQGISSYQGIFSISHSNSVLSKAPQSLVPAGSIAAAPDQPLQHPSAQGYPSPGTQLLQKVRAALKPTAGTWKTLGIHTVCWNEKGANTYPSPWGSSSTLPQIHPEHSLRCQALSWLPKWSEFEANLS